MYNLNKEAEKYIENYMFKKFILYAGLIGSFCLIVGWFLNDIAVQKTKNDVFSQSQKTIFAITMEAAKSSQKVEQLKIEALPTFLWIEA